VVRAEVLGRDCVFIVTESAVRRRLFCVDRVKKCCQDRRKWRLSDCSAGGAIRRWGGGTFLKCGEQARMRFIGVLTGAVEKIDFL